MNIEALIKLQSAGHVNAAAQGYRNLIAKEPENVLAYENLAVICLMAGRFDEALPLLQSAHKLNPENPATLLRLGAVCRHAGDNSANIGFLQKAVAIAPEYAEAHLNLGVACAELGDLDGAIRSYQRAIEVKPDFTEAHYNLGNVYNAQGKTADAISCYHQALALRPQYAEAWLNLGNSYRSNNDEAYACYQKAIAANPNYADAYLNLGKICADRGEFETAVSLARKVLELQPDYAEGYNNLGVSLRELSKGSEALECFRKALEINSRYVEAHMNLGLMLKDMGHLREASECQKKAIELMPDNPSAFKNLGAAYLALGDTDGAVSILNRYLDLACSKLGASSRVRDLGRLLLELHRLPVVYKNSGEVISAREHYTDCLTRARDLVKGFLTELAPEELEIIRELLFNISNFYLGYQQLNDKALQVAYSSLATELLRPDIKQHLIMERRPRTGGKIRLGFASSFLRYNNGSYWAYGWLSNLPRDDYEFYLYSLNGVTDDTTARFAELGTYRWLPFSHLTYLRSVESIKADNLDILLLPDVGMSAQSRIISLMRLAPVQCVAFAHPITTGSPTIDYYLSSDLMETANADEHYSEKLVRLPNTGFHFEFPPVPAQQLTRADFDIGPERIIYGSVQSLFKYLPAHDYIYAAIARRVPNAIFLFVANESDYVTSIFEERIKKSFEREGLDSEHYVRVLPRMSLPRFLQMLAVLDVNIDSFGWNGGTTTLRSLAVDCPVVTYPGEFMRSRHSYSILRVIDANELIAGSPDEYIELAARIGQDRQFRATVVEKIKTNKSRLFNDMECVRYLDKFFKSAVLERAGRQGVRT